MKKISIIGVILGIITLILCIYGFFIVVPNSDNAAIEMEIIINNTPSDIPLGENYDKALSVSNFLIDFSTYLLILSGLTVVLNLLTILKKQTLSWLGFIFGLIGLVFGIIYGTHMFA